MKFGIQWENLRGKGRKSKRRVEGGIIRPSGREGGGGLGGGGWSKKDIYRESSSGGGGIYNKGGGSESFDTQNLTLH